MSCLTFDGTDDEVVFTPISSALSGLPNGAGTIAVLARCGSVNPEEYFVQLLNSAQSAWYHGLGFYSAVGDLVDDDGIVGSFNNSNIATATSGAGNYRILVVDWPSGGAAVERFHWSGLFSGAESWTHSDATASNGGNRAGPGTSGRLELAGGSGLHWFAGDIALVGIWAGVRFSDANVLDLWTNLKTSDWYNHAAGTPTTLIECTSTSPTDIGANPSTLSAVTGATASGPDPTGWTFDGIGTTPQVILPDADTTTTGWTSTPLWSKVNDSSDATVVTATLS